MRILYLAVFLAWSFPALSQQPNAVGGQQGSQPTTDQNRSEPGAADSVTTHFAPGNRVDRGTYQAICDSPKNKDHADLCQQWRVAEAAETQIVLTVLGFLALVGTLMFTGITAVAARHAVVAANRTADEAKKIGEAQVRAYLSCDGATCRITDHWLSCEVRVRNHGQSPAIWTKITGRTGIGDVIGKRPDGTEGPIFMRSKPFDNFGPAISAGKDAELFVLWSHVDLGEGAHKAALENEARVTVFATIEWRDVFNELHSLEVALIPDRDEPLIPGTKRVLKMQAYNRGDYRHKHTE